MSDPSPAADAEPTSARRSLLGSPGRIQRLARKELRETLRDRRTIITLVLMPILVYPLLSLVFQRFVLSQRKSETELVYHIGVESEEEWETLYQTLESGNRALQVDAAAMGKTDADDSSPRLSYAVEGSLADAVAKNKVDVAVDLIPTKPQNGQPPSWQVELIGLRTSAFSREALAYLTERLIAARAEFLENRLKTTGIEARPSPVHVAQSLVKPASGTATFSLASVVPLILVLMTITGAVYPAIDLTAGERERGTLEALIAAPVPRMGLLVAKYIAVVTVAMLTATMNLIAMTVTILAVGLGPMLFGPEGLTVLLVAQVFALLMLFAAFFSAVLLAITSFARSFKEAQAYLIPVMLLSMAPGIVSLLPGVELNAGLAVTPLLNIVLLARDLCEHHASDGVLTVVVVVSTALFAAGALAIAARIFGADAILYGSQGTWGDLLRKDPGSETPTLASALLVLALLFPSYFLLSHALAQTGEMTGAVQLALSGSLTILLFAGFPLLACRLRGLPTLRALQVRHPPLLAVLGALLLGTCLWTGAFEAVVFASNFGVTPLDASTAEKMEGIIQRWKALSPAFVVLALAVAPGVCEELFFRGFLLTALRSRMARWPAILTSAALFGVFHLITTDSLTVVRFLPSTLLGVALGWICVRTGSVLPGMLMHATHNGLLLLVAIYKDDLKARGWGLDEVTHLPPMALAGAAVVAVIGFGLIALSTPWSSFAPRKNASAAEQSSAS
jgi:ABC-2 type transport system permease protein/sodium transport system permease protein